MPDDIVAQQIRLKLKLNARLRVQGVIVRGRGVYSCTGREAALQQVPTPAARPAIVQLYTLWDQAVETQHEALVLLRRQVQQYPEISRFRTVPGIGFIGAARFSDYIQTPYRFSSKRKLWRYCRLGITERSSDGKRLGLKRLDHTGLGRLKDVSRKAFISARHSQSNNAFKRSSQQTLARTHNDHMPASPPNGKFSRYCGQCGKEVQFTKTTKERLAR